MRFWRNGRRCGRGGKARKSTRGIFALVGPLGQFAFAVSVVAGGFIPAAKADERRQIAKALIDLAEQSITARGGAKDGSGWIVISQPGQYSVAEIHCRMATLIDPRFYEAHICLASAIYDGSHVMLWPVASSFPAYDVLAKAIFIDPDRADAHILQAQYLHESIATNVMIAARWRREARLALERLSPGLGRHEREAVFDNVADMMWRADRHANFAKPYFPYVDDVFARMQTRWPGRPETFFAMGEVTLSLNEWKAALTYYSRALALGPDEVLRERVRKRVDRIDRDCRALATHETCIDKFVDLR